MGSTELPRYLQRGESIRSVDPGNPSIMLAQDTANRNPSHHSYDPYATNPPLTHLSDIHTELGSTESHIQAREEQARAGTVTYTSEIERSIALGSLDARRVSSNGLHGVSDGPVLTTPQQPSPSTKMSRSVLYGDMWPDFAFLYEVGDVELYYAGSKKPFRVNIAPIGVQENVFECVGSRSPCWRVYYAGGLKVAFDIVKTQKVVMGAPVYRIQDGNMKDIAVIIDPKSLTRNCCAYCTLSTFYRMCGSSLQVHRPDSAGDDFLQADESFPQARVDFTGCARGSSQIVDATGGQPGTITESHLMCGLKACFGGDSHCTCFSCSPSSGVVVKFPPYATASTRVAILAISLLRWSTSPNDEGRSVKALEQKAAKAEAKNAKKLASQQQQQEQTGAPPMMLKPL